MPGNIHEHLQSLGRDEITSLSKTCMFVALRDSSPSSDYMRVRKAWNKDAMGWPALIAQPRSPEDVAALIKFAKNQKRHVCVKTFGGHSNHALVDDAICIDLSLLRKTEMNLEAQPPTIEVGGGCVIGDVDKCSKPHGLALPMGHVYHTGVAGMALNATSGVGYLTRTRGLCVEYLREVTIVLQSGEILDVSAESHPELFWGICGAASNFGVVTRMVNLINIVLQ